MAQSWTWVMVRTVSANIPEMATLTTLRGREGEEARPWHLQSRKTQLYKPAEFAQHLESTLLVLSFINRYNAPAILRVLKTTGRGAPWGLPPFPLLTDLRPCKLLARKHTATLPALWTLATPLYCKPPNKCFKRTERLKQRCSLF